ATLLESGAGPAVPRRGGAWVRGAEPAEPEHRPGEGAGQAGADIRIARPERALAIARTVARQGGPAGVRGHAMHEHMSADDRKHGTGAAPAGTPVVARSARRHQRQP